MRRWIRFLLGLALVAGCLTAVAQKDPDVGEVPMSPRKTILENAGSSPIHKNLVDGLRAAGLVETLSGRGPFTVFAPTDDAFAKLPAGSLDSLMKPENKTALGKVLTYHVVPGKITSKKLAKMVKKGHGSAALKTVEGGVLTVKVDGSIISLVDEKGGISTLTTADVYAKNGVMHVIDTVLMPN